MQTSLITVREIFVAKYQRPTFRIFPEIKKIQNSAKC